MSRHLIVGFGEVGRALFSVLDGHGHFVDAVDCHVRTPEKRYTDYDAIHICVPFTTHIALKQLVEDKTMLAYRVVTPETIVVLHSTVSLGATRILAEATKLKVVHSPVRGTHPDLRAGLLTFVKYIGGRDSSRVAGWFEDCGMRTRTFPDPETTEAIKLWDTTQYGWQIVLAKEIADWCRANGVDFSDVYQTANRDYNRGYEKLGRPEVVRPSLEDVPGPIGGHCIMPNLLLLGPNPITDTVLAANVSYLQAQKPALT